MKVTKNYKDNETMKEKFNKYNIMNIANRID